MNVVPSSESLRHLRKPHRSQFGQSADGDYCNPFFRTGPVYWVSNKVVYFSRRIRSCHENDYDTGTSVGVTIDFDAVSDRMRRVRDRDTTPQVRAGLDKIVATLVVLVNSKETVEAVVGRLADYHRQLNAGSWLFGQSGAMPQD